MRLRLALILLLAVSSARAELNTESLPAGAVGLVAIDIAAFRRTKFGQALEGLANMKGKDLEASRKLSEQLGVDSKKDLHDLIIAIYPDADGKVSEKNASGVVLIRGKFQPKTIDAFGTKNGIPSKVVGKHKAWEAGAFIEKFSGEKPKPETKDAYVVAHSETLLIVAGAEFLERALTAADHHEKAALLPAPISAKFAAAQQGWLYLYADASKMKRPDNQVGLENLSLVLGENASDVQLATAADFVSAEKAATMRKQLAALQAIAPLGLSETDGKSASQKEDQALLLELVQKIRIGGVGKQLTLALDFPADKAVRAISKVIDKAQQGPGVLPAAK